MIISGSKNAAGCCCGCSCTTTPQCTSLGYCISVQFGAYCGSSFPVTVWPANCYEVYTGGSQCPNQLRGEGSAYILNDTDSGSYYSGSFCPPSQCNDYGLEYTVCGAYTCQGLAECLACEYFAMLYGESAENCTGGGGGGGGGECTQEQIDACDAMGGEFCPNSCNCPCYVP